MTTGLRRATREDAPLLQTCFALASHGMAPWFWEQARKDGQSLDEVAQARMLSKISDPGNDTWVDASGGGAVLSYTISDDPEPLDDLPDFIVPLVKLENRVPGTRYINVLATLPAFRRQGIARRLLAQALADGDGRPATLIVEDGNAEAIALYESAGFRELAREAVVKGGWSAKSDDWILMGT